VVPASPGERRLSEQAPAEKAVQRAEKLPVAAVLPATADEDTESGSAGESGERVAAPAKDARASVPSKPAAAGLVKRVLPPGYFAQVAAPKSLGEAEQTARQLKSSGFPVVIEVSSKRGQDFYRVLVGPEQNRVHAERLVGQLKSERYLVGAPFIRQAE
jgi:cell division septation protein DedD